MICKQCNVNSVAVSSKAAGLPVTRRLYAPLLRTSRTLFNKIRRCDYHILQFYLSDRPEVVYNLRKHQHNKTLTHKTVDLNDRESVTSWCATSIRKLNMN